MLSKYHRVLTAVRFLNKYSNLCGNDELCGVLQVVEPRRQHSTSQTWQGFDSSCFDSWLKLQSESPPEFQTSGRLRSSENVFHEISRGVCDWRGKEKRKYHQESEGYMLLCFPNKNEGWEFSYVRRQLWLFFSPLSATSVLRWSKLRE